MKLLSFNLMYLILLTLLLFLSFNPTESEGSHLSLYLRLIPFFAFSWLFILNSQKTKIPLRELLFLIFVCILILIINFSAITPRLVFQLLVVITTFFFVIVVDKNNQHKHNFKKILNFLILIWVFSLFVQLAAYHFFGYLIDFHSMVFRFSESRILSGQNIMRFGGFQIEPGTYSNWIYSVVILRAFLIRKISTPLHWLAIFSMLFTTSFWAVMAFLFFAIAVFLEEKTKRKLMFVLFMPISFVAVYFFFGDDYFSYILLRTELSSGTATGKLEVYQYMANHVDKWLLLGAGLESVPCSYCTSSQDAGVGLSLLYYFGFIALFVLIKFTNKSIQLLGLKSLFLIVPFFFSKFYFWDPITIMIIIFVIFYSYNDDNLKLKESNNLI